MLIETSENFKDLNYENIFVNWENSKPNFMLWLRYVCGINEEVYNMINQLIKDNCDIQEWVKYFDGDFDHILETTELYKMNLVERTPT